MKQIMLMVALTGAIIPGLAQKATHTTTGGEWIFSFADAKINGTTANDIIRFSPVFNIQVQVHRDFSDHAGLMTGFNIRNVGFIYDDPFNPGTRYKTRNYTLGVPIGLKFGKMDGKYIFGGYEIELPFAYKEKKFVNDEKVSKFDEWFSSRTETFYHTLFVGVNMVEGTQIKFKYYLTNWFNKSYMDAQGTKPYANFDANVFYISLSFQILRGTDFYYKRGQ